MIGIDIHIAVVIVLIMMVHVGELMGLNVMKEVS